MADPRRPDYYTLTPHYPPKPGEMVLVNASIGRCLICGGTATGMGGSNRDICLACGDALLAYDKARRQGESA